MYSLFDVSSIIADCPSLLRVTVRSFDVFAFSLRARVQYVSWRRAAFPLIYGRRKAPVWIH